MSTKVKLKVNVVDAAKQRILHAFKIHKYVLISFSGGKDSIVMADIVLKTMQEYNIDYNRLIFVFFDEEAIYPDVERLVIHWRQKALSLGCKFWWFCLQIRHHNCCNSLANDESFICFDMFRKEDWVRQPPKYAIRSHKDFKRGMTYQEFSKRLTKDLPAFTGVRVAESVQRRMNIAKKSVSGNMDETQVQVIYDWKDSDVWLYLYKNNLDIPETYMYLYKCGVGKRGMRLSQFFSIDTIKSLPKVAEFYPELYDKVLKREPNASLVSLYFQTKLFRSKRSQSNEKKGDAKKEFLEMLEKARKNPKDYAGFKKVRSGLLPHMVPNFTYPDSVYRQLTGILTAGDPKNREQRACRLRITKAHDIKQSSNEQRRVSKEKDSTKKS